MQPNDQVTPQELLRRQRAVQDAELGWRKRFDAAQHDLTLRQWAVDAAIRSSAAGTIMSYQDIHAFLIAAYQLPEASND